MNTMERADNGNWFTPAAWNFYADDGFGNLVRVSSWPAMNHSSEDLEVTELSSLAVESIRLS